jgi:head-tail adaptor
MAPLAEQGEGGLVGSGDDGAEIHADVRGFAAREGTEASEWRVSATLRFRTHDARYA